MSVCNATLSFHLQGCFLTFMFMNLSSFDKSSIVMKKIPHDVIQKGKKFLNILYYFFCCALQKGEKYQKSSYNFFFIFEWHGVMRNLLHVNTGFVHPSHSLHDINFVFLILSVAFFFSHIFNVVISLTNYPT